MNDWLQPSAATPSTSLPSAGPEGRVPVWTAEREPGDRKWAAAPTSAGFSECEPQQVARGQRLDAAPECFQMFRRVCAGCLACPFFRAVAGQPENPQIPDASRTRKLLAERLRNPLL